MSRSMRQTEQGERSPDPVESGQAGEYIPIPVLDFIMIPKLDESQMHGGSTGSWSKKKGLPSIINMETEQKTKLFTLTTKQVANSHCSNCDNLALERCLCAPMYMKHWLLYMDHTQVWRKWNYEAFILGSLVIWSVSPVILNCVVHSGLGRIFRNEVYRKPTHTERSIFTLWISPPAQVEVEGC